MSSSHALTPLSTSNFLPWLSNQAETALVVFSAPWCVACRMLHPTLEALAGESPGRDWIGQVDVEQTPELAERFSVHSLPTLILFRDGAPVASLIGAVPKRVIEDALERARITAAAG